MSQFFVGVTAGSLPPSVPTSFPTDSGTAIPIGNILNVVTPGGGTQGISTSGAGNTITITLTDKTLTGTATTVGATTANINTLIPIPTNSATSLIVNIAGYDAVNGNCVGGESIALVKNVAGTLTVVGTSDVTRNNDATLSAWNITLIAIGTNALVQVLGVTGVTIQWRANIEIVTAP